MAFESLSDKLQNVFKNLRGKGRLSEADVKAALKEVKMALLEADVSFKVVKQFVNSVQERAIGQDVLNSLTPGQMVVKIVHEELISLMGSETKEIELKPASEITVIMMAGLQGAGKTTTTAKIAGKLKAKGRKPLLVACDVYRPAAIQQLQINGEKQGVPVFSMGDNQKPVNIAKAAIEHAQKNGFNVVILDTAGRLHVDEDMMAELQEIKREVQVHQTLLIVDAMTGQDAVNVAENFENKIGIDGVILTKMDGDTRGGAALSIRAVTGKPIFYAGMGEKLSDLEQFYPDRMASRILGMGDVLTLIEKAQEDFDEAFIAAAEKTYEAKEQEVTTPIMRELERVIMLRVVDEYWMDHIDAMDDLKQGVRLQGYGNNNPVDVYKRESLEMFEEMVSAIQDETVRRLYSVRLRKDEEVKRERVAKATVENVGGDGTTPKKQPVKKTIKIGRNDPCPCGSGLKWKKCTCKEYHPDL